MTEWKDLGEVSRGQQSISFIHEEHGRHEENHVSSSTKDTKGTKRTMCLLPRRTRKARREDFKENGHVQTSAPQGAMVLRHWGGPLASKLAGPTPVLQNHTFGANSVHDENRFA